MNPLHRKMFRQPGMSRQPAGILASSPELSNVVRQRMGQPVQMANGGEFTDFSGSRDANERAFRAGATRGLIPDALSALAAQGANVSNRLKGILSKYPKSGFAAPLLKRAMSMSVAEQEALADQIEASEVETISRGKDPSIAQGIGTLREVGDVLTSDITPLSDLKRKLNPNLRVDVGIGSQGGIEPSISPPTGIDGGLAAAAANVAATPGESLMGTRSDVQFEGETRDPNLDVDVGAAGLGVEPPIEDQAVSPNNVVSEEDSPLETTVTKPKKTGTNVVSVEKLEALQDESLMGTQKDEMFAGEINNVLNSDLSDQEKNDGILEITGGKDPNKKLTTEERVKANIELYEKYLGVDASDKYDMNDAAIDFGLALASGDSPDMLTNVVSATKDTLGKFRENKATRKARKDKLKMLGLTKAFDDEKEERQWDRELKKINISQQYDWTKTVFTNTKDMERFNSKMAFDKTALVSKLNTQIEIANANADNAAIRDKANNEAALLRAKIGALPDGHAAAYVEFEGKDFTDPKVAADFHKRADEIAENLAKNKATSQTRKGYGVGEVEVLIANAVQDQINAMIKDGITPTEDQRKEITRQVRGTYATALSEAQGPPNDGFGEMTTTK